MSLPRCSCLMLALAAILASPAAAGLEDELNSRWRGGSTVVLLPIHSSCDAFYNDNDVAGAPAAPRVTGSGPRQFDAGELAQVERIAAKRGRLDVFLDLVEPVLLARRDGPFTLYDERRCKVQLKVELPRAALRDSASASAALASSLEQHSGGVETAASWNRRRREDYPPDYQRTLAEYETWKAQQVNAAVGAKLTRVSADAAGITDRVRRDADYLDGFGAGVEAQRNVSLGDCHAILDANFSTRGHADRGDAKDRGAWDRGWEDGQRLAWSLEVLRRLPDCFVPVPPPLD